MTPQLYTASRLRVLRECPRKHHLRYALGLTTPATAEMRFGIEGHAALEVYLRTWQEGHVHLRLGEALAVLDAADLSAFERAKLRLLVIAYHERWGAEDWEILAVEQEFRYELGDHLIGGKIDGLIRERATGRVFVLEHKFTGAETSLGGPYWERLALDTQVSIYIDGAAMLGHQIAGCIYDVIKRPEHEQRLATPPEARKYTTGRGCKACGGSAKPGAIERGRGHLVVAFASSVEQPPCEACAGTGWKLDKEGKPDAPRLHANQREADETLEEFEERLLDVIAERPDDFLQRGVIVRLENELPAMRLDLIEWIALAELGVAPRNDSACARAGRLCGFWPICTGKSDASQWPSGPVHPELEANNAA